MRASSSSLTRCPRSFLPVHTERGKAGGRSKGRERTGPCNPLGPIPSCTLSHIFSPSQFLLRHLHAPSLPFSLPPSFLTWSRYQNHHFRSRIMTEDAFQSTIVGNAPTRPRLWEIHEHADDLLFGYCCRPPRNSSLLCPSRCLRGRIPWSWQMEIGFVRRA